MVWLITILATILINYALAYYSCKHYPDSWFFNGLMVGNIMTEAAHLMHDCMHRLVHPSTKVCYSLGWFCGELCFGVSSLWWQTEHDVHHAATNTWDRISGDVFDLHEIGDMSCQNDIFFHLY